MSLNSLCIVSSDFLTRELKAIRLDFSIKFATNQHIARMNCEFFLFSISIEYNSKFEKLKFRIY